MCGYYPFPQGLCHIFLHQRQLFSSLLAECFDTSRILGLNCYFLIFLFYLFTSLYWNWRCLSFSFLCSHCSCYTFHFLTFERQFVKNCVKGLRFYATMKLTSLPAMVLWMPVEQRMSLIHIAVSVARVSAFCTSIPCPSSHRVMPRGQMTLGHAVRYIKGL